MSQVTKLTRALILAIPLLGATFLTAQLPQAEVTIGKVEIEFIGVQNVNEAVLRSNMQVRSGMVYTEAIVDDSLRALYGTGLFEYIDVKRTEETGGSLDLIFRVKSK